MAPRGDQLPSHRVDVSRDFKTCRSRASPPSPTAGKRTLGEVFVNELLEGGFKAGGLGGSACHPRPERHRTIANDTERLPNVTKLHLTEPKDTSWPSMFEFVQRASPSVRECFFAHDLPFPLSSCSLSNPHRRRRRRLKINQIYSGEHPDTYPTITTNQIYNLEGTGEPTRL